MKKRKHHYRLRYKFLKWLIRKAVYSTKIYWLLWGMLAVLAICAWRFGAVW